MTKDEEWRRFLTDAQEPVVASLGAAVVAAVGKALLVVKPLVWSTHGEGGRTWRALALTDRFVVIAQLSMGDVDVLNTTVSVVPLAQVTELRWAIQTRRAWTEQFSTLVTLTSGASTVTLPPTYRTHLTSDELAWVQALSERI